MNNMNLKCFIGKGISTSFFIVKCLINKILSANSVESGDSWVWWVRIRVSCDFIYHRRYARWFSEDTIRGAGELLTYASKNAHLWCEAIESWQNPILQDRYILSFCEDMNLDIFFDELQITPYFQGSQMRSFFH